MSILKKPKIREYFLISFFLCLIIILFNVLTRYFNKGFDFTDESFYLLSYLYPDDYTNSVSLSHFFGSLILDISGHNLVNLRYAGFFILICSVLFFLFGIMKFAKENYFNFDDNNKASLFLLPICLISVLHYYYFYIPTPNYNLFNFALYLIYSSLVCCYFSYNKKKIWIVLINLVILFIALNKITSAFLLIIISIFYLRKHIIFLSISGISIVFIWFLIHFYFLKENFFYIFEISQNFLFNTLEKSDMSSHQLDRVLFNQFKILYNNLINSRLTIAFVVLSCVSFLTKKNFNLIFGIFFSLYIFKFNNIFLFLKLLCFYNLFYYLIINKKNIYLKNFILSFSILLISLSFAFGTNNRIDFQMNLVSIFSVVCIYFISISDKIKKLYVFSYSILFITCLFFSTLLNLKEINYQPHRINYTLDQNNEVFESFYNKRLFEKLLIDKDTKDFINQVETTFIENNWKKKNYLLDGSLKMPGLLLIVDAKFILYPAFFHKKKMLFKSYNNLKTKNINTWIVMIKNRDNYFFEIYDKSEFFEINNQLSQKIKFYNHKKINIRDYNLFKPIN